TIAKQLQEHFGQGTLLVSQDVVRRDMLRVHDTIGNLSHDLLFEITKYGKGKCEFVVLPLAEFPLRMINVDFIGLDIMYSPNVNDYIENFNK
ncbi:hypothetical protein ACT453_12135, partial [Bacillus sp. D-CC]